VRRVDFVLQLQRFTGNLDNVSVVQISNRASILFAGQDDGSSTLYNQLRMPNSSTLARMLVSSNTTASNSVLIGTNAGRYINADRNFIFGSYAGENTTTGYGNTMFAYQAGRNNTTGTDNLFLGNAAGLWNKTGSGNIFIGNRTGSQIIADSLSGYNNILIGSNAGDNIRAAAIGNVGIGNQIDLPTNNGSNQVSYYQNVLFFHGCKWHGNNDCRSLESRDKNECAKP
jgi:hypothetical protein